MPSIEHINYMFKQLEEVMNKCDSLSQDLRGTKSSHKKRN